MQPQACPRPRHDPSEEVCRSSPSAEALPCTTAILHRVECTTKGGSRIANQPLSFEDDYDNEGALEEIAKNIAKESKQSQAAAHAAAGAAVARSTISNTGGSGASSSTIQAGGSSTTGSSTSSGKPVWRPGDSEDMDPELRPVEGGPPSMSVKLAHALAVNETVMVTWANHALLDFVESWCVCICLKLEACLMERGLLAWGDCARLAHASAFGYGMEQQQECGSLLSAVCCSWKD